MNELKRELSKLTGIDFFNPKFRAIFKKHFPDERDAEEERVEEGLNDEEKEVEETPVMEEVADVDNADEKEAEKEIEDKVEDIDKAEDEREIDKIEEEKADDVEKEDEKSNEVNEESKEIGKDVDELKDEKTKDEELLDAKVELELIKSGVKPEKVETAKKYVKHEISNIGELDRIKSIIAEFPDWVRSYKSEDIGMPVDDDNDALTEEEKRLKEMGIDPR